MAGKSKYNIGLFRDLELAYVKIGKLEQENEQLKLRISLLEDENRRLKLENEKEKINNDKDSTCSAIPSSKNQIGKVGITNSRKKSDNKPGATQGHKPKFLSINTINKLKSDPKTKVVKNKINYNSKNKNKTPIVRHVIGFQIIPVIYEYEIYPNEDGKYDIPKEFHAQVQYAPEVKTLATDLFYNRNVSTDNISSFFQDLLGYKISKGTIINWEKELEKKLMPETRNILKELMKQPYNHVDESQANVNGKNYNIHNVSSNKHTMQWIHKNKSHKAIEEIGFLTEYVGTLIKDGTHLYDKYATDFVSCGAHIIRYLIGANKGTYHIGEERLIMFLNGLKRRRKKLVRQGANSVSDVEYKNIVNQYKHILNCWNEEIKKDKNINPMYDEERKLQARLLSDKDQHLKFMTNFSLPFTNNRAETDIRGVKTRLKVGIFRNEEAAERYVTIRSCISTYRKNNINVFSAIQSAFDNKTIIV